MSRPTTPSNTPRFRAQCSHYRSAATIRTPSANTVHWPKRPTARCCSSISNNQIRSAMAGGSCSVRVNLHDFDLHGVARPPAKEDERFERFVLGVFNFVFVRIARAAVDRIDQLAHYGVAFEITQLGIVLAQLIDPQLPRLGRRVDEEFARLVEVTAFDGLKKTIGGLRRFLYRTFLRAAR